jgi:hypothetical protein
MYGDNDSNYDDDDDVFFLLGDSLALEFSVPTFRTRIVP